MGRLVCFEVIFLGIKEPGRVGKAKVANAMSRLTGKDPSEFESLDAERGKPLFGPLSREKASLVAEALGEAGAIIEIRPVQGEFPRGDSELVEVQRCPRCGFIQPAGAEECASCGLVFAKWEKEQLEKMQRQRQLEETLAKVSHVREEWRKKAYEYLKHHPLDPSELSAFEGHFYPTDLPFLKLDTEEASFLLTAKVMLIKIGRRIYSVPYELIEDVDVSAGLSLKKDKLKLTVKFHGPLPLGHEPVKSISVKISRSEEHVGAVMTDWAFARTFNCAACGSPDLDYRFERGKVRARCMHCAADHVVDLTEAMISPA